MANVNDKTTTEVRVEVPELELQTFPLHIVGDSPLICHAWSHKAKLMMLEKRQKKASLGKEIARPWVDFAESLYWLTDKPNFDGLTDEQARDILQDVIPHSKFGFPVIAFKAAALSAGFQQGALVRNAGTNDLAKTSARGAFHIIGDELAEIIGVPTMREDMVRLGGASRQADLRYRGEFKSWRIDLPIRFNPKVISMAQIINLFRLAGFANGVGEWRPEHDGKFGTFHVE